MKSKFIVLCFIMVWLFAVTTVCTAATYDDLSINDESESITIYGTPEGAKSGDSVKIQILKEGVSSEDIAVSYTNKEDILSHFVLFTQIAADENGAYSETVSMIGEEPGYYTIRVNGEDVAEIYYATKTNREHIVQQIQDNCISEDITQEDAVAYLSEKFEISNSRSVWMNCFSINEELIGEVDEDSLFKVFLGFVPELTIDNIKDSLNKSAYITAIDENKADVMEYADLFELDKKYTDAYSEYFSDEEKESFNEEYFADKNYMTISDVNAAYEDAVVHKWANTLSGWGEVENIIETFGNDIGINMTSKDDKYNFDKLKTSQKTELYENVLDKKEFSTVEKFVDFVNDEIEDLSKDSKKSSGGGGGGGGFVAGNGSVNTQVTTPAVTPVDPDAVPEVTVDFSDMEAYDWAKESVDSLSKKGIVSGTGNGNFEPGRNVTREEFLVMLMRAYGITEGSDGSSFTDSVSGSWYAPYLAEAKANGYVSGRPDGTFGVGDEITREDACVMAHNIAKSHGKTFALDTVEAFTDNNEIAAYAIDSVYALKNASIINGKGEGMFAPKDNCTRAEAAKIIYTLISL